jgi:hypothetical protein
VSRSEAILQIATLPVALTIGVLAMLVIIIMSRGA